MRLRGVKRKDREVNSHKVAQRVFAPFLFFFSAILG